jgi:hypothetical protein
MQQKGKQAVLSEWMNICVLIETMAAKKCLDNAKAEASALDKAKDMLMRPIPEAVIPELLKLKVRPLDSI